MLAQQEGQQHQHPAIVDDPPHIDVTLRTGLTVAGEEGDVFGHQQGQVGGCGHSHRVYKKKSGTLPCGVLKYRSSDACTFNAPKAKKEIKSCALL